MNKRSGSLSGRVTARNQPVADAVILIAEGPEHHDLAALTDDQGRYRLDDLTPGTYTLLVQVEGFPAQRQSVRVTGDRAAQLDFAL